MPHFYNEYIATVPPMYFGHSGIDELLHFFQEGRNGEAAEFDTHGLHFRVITDGRNEQEWEYSDRDIRIMRLQGGAVMYGHPIYDRLPALILQGLICLVEVSRWNHGDADEDDCPCRHAQDRFDPVELAEQVPTLVLREVLAKRLGT